MPAKESDHVGNNVGDGAGDYAAYLLRLWKSNERGSAVWRASLESTAEGRRYNFAQVEALITFLQKRFGRLSEERQATLDDQPNPTSRRNL